MGYKMASPLSQHVNTYLVNNSGTVGYCAAQLSKGRIIVIDNELFDGMLVDRKYVLAHTPNVVLKRPFSNPAYDSGLETLFIGLTGGGIGTGESNN